MSLVAVIKGVTVAELIGASAFLAPAGGGAYWALDRMIASAVAGEKFATQQSLDEQVQALGAMKLEIEALKKQQNEMNLQTGVISSDIGTVKALQKENRDDIKSILRGISKLNN